MVRPLGVPHDLAMVDITTANVAIVHRGEGRVVGPPDPSLPLPTIELKLTAAHDAGFSLIEMHVPPHFRPPPVLHRHTREGAVVYILEGALRYLFSNGAETTAGAGTLVHLPPGAWFRWENATDAPVRMLCMFSPAGFEEYFAEVAAAIERCAFDPAALATVIPPLRAKYGDEDLLEP